MNTDHCICSEIQLNIFFASGMTVGQDFDEVLGYDEKMGEDSLKVRKVLG